MKNKKRKSMNAKLLKAIKSVLKDNKAVLSNKAEKTLKKSIKQIVKKTDKRREAIPSRKMKKSALNSDKIKLDGAATARPSQLTT
jgi:hypothetical protein